MAFSDSEMLPFVLLSFLHLLKHFELLVVRMSGVTGVVITGGIKFMMTFTASSPDRQSMLPLRTTLSSESYIALDNSS